MTKTQLQLLKTLYLIFSPSRHELEMSLFVRSMLDKMNIKYNILDNQIFNFVAGQPILVAHMDQVSSKKLEKVYDYRNCVFGEGNLGADDKNGIWIILQLLKILPNTSFIFSTGEEVGFDIDDVLKINKEKLEKIPYGLVFDRRNGKDIIGYQNDYCNKDLEKDIQKIGEHFGYNSAVGTISDCDQLSTFGIPCVNLSCGYYNPHSEDEFTDLLELENSLAFGYKILSSLTKSYSRVLEKSYRGYYYYYYSTHVGNYTTTKTSKSENTNLQQWENRYLEFADWGYIVNTTDKGNMDSYPCFRCWDTKVYNKEICNSCSSLKEWYEVEEKEICVNCRTSLKDAVILHSSSLNNEILMCSSCGSINESTKPATEYSYLTFCPTCLTTTSHTHFGKCEECGNFESEEENILGGL